MFSGPQVGESVSAFRVLQVLDSDESKELQINPQEGKVTFLVFFHKVSEPAIGLAITLEWFAGRQQGLDSHYVLLTDDKLKAEQKAKRWSSRSLLFNSSWCISLDGAEGPGSYGLNRNVLMTLIVAKDNVVVSNFSLSQPNNTDASGILAALAKALDQPAPSYEKIRAELAAHRAQQREQRTTTNPVFKLAPDRELGRLMLAMVYRENVSEEYVQKASQQLTKWAGTDKQKNAALVEYCKTLLKGNIKFHRYAREALKKLAGEQ